MKVLFITALFIAAVVGEPEASLTRGGPSPSQTLGPNPGYGTIGYRYYYHPLIYGGRFVPYDGYTHPGYRRYKREAEPEASITGHGPSPEPEASITGHGPFPEPEASITARGPSPSQTLGPNPGPGSKTFAYGYYYPLGYAGRYVYGGRYIYGGYPW